MTNGFYYRLDETWGSGQQQRRDGLPRSTLQEGYRSEEGRTLGYAERLISSIRRECLDDIVDFGKPHLRRILGAYASYYNEVRTHLSLVKDSPSHRPIQRFGQLGARPILG